MAGAAVLSTFTYIPLLVKGLLGGSELIVTVLTGTYATASFVGSYLFGRAGDIYGRRLTLRLGLLFAALSFALLYLVDSMEVLFLVRALNGFTVGMYPGALAAYAYESKMKMGRFASFGSLGWGVGTLIAGYAASFELRLAFVIASLFFCLAFLSSLTLPPIDRVRVKVPLFPVETMRRNLPVYIAVLIRHSSAHALWTLWPLFLVSLGADEFAVGIIQATNSISQFFFMILITDKYDCHSLIQTGLGTTAVAFTYFLVVALYFDWVQLLPSQLLLGFAWSCLYVGALKYVTQNNVERATASGLLTSIMSVSGVIGPVIAAVLYSLWPGYVLIILYGTVMSLVAMVVFGRSDRGPIDAEA